MNWAHRGLHRQYEAWGMANKIYHGVALKVASYHDYWTQPKRNPIRSMDHIIMRTREELEENTRWITTLRQAEWPQTPHDYFENILWTIKVAVSPWRGETKYSRKGILIPSSLLVAAPIFRTRNTTSPIWYDGRELNSDKRILVTYTAAPEKGGIRCHLDGARLWVRNILLNPLLQRAPGPSASCTAFWWILEKVPLMYW